MRGLGSVAEAFVIVAMFLIITTVYALTHPIVVSSHERYEDSVKDKAVTEMVNFVKYLKVMLMDNSESRRFSIDLPPGYRIVIKNSTSLYKFPLIRIKVLKYRGSGVTHYLELDFISKSFAIYVRSGGSYQRCSWGAIPEISNRSTINYPLRQYGTAVYYNPNPEYTSKLSVYDESRSKWYTFVLYGIPGALEDYVIFYEDLKCVSGHIDGNGDEIIRVTRIYLQDESRIMYRVSLFRASGGYRHEFYFVQPNGDGEIQVYVKDYNRGYSNVSRVVGNIFIYNEVYSDAINMPSVIEGTLVGDPSDATFASISTDIYFMGPGMGSDEAYYEIRKVLMTGPLANYISSVERVNESAIKVSSVTVAMIDVGSGTGSVISTGMLVSSNKEIRWYDREILIRFQWQSYLDLIDIPVFLIEVYR